jgi:hypothetical protein
LERWRILRRRLRKRRMRFFLHCKKFQVAASAGAESGQHGNRRFQRGTMQRITESDSGWKHEKEMSRAKEKGVKKINKP